MATRCSVQERSPDLPTRFAAFDEVVGILFATRPPFILRFIFYDDERLYKLFRLYGTSV
jgi:hypothetical protein